VQTEFFGQAPTGVMHTIWSGGHKRVPEKHGLGAVGAKASRLAPPDKATATKPRMPRPRYRKMYLMRLVGGSTWRHASDLEVLAGQGNEEFSAGTEVPRELEDGAYGSCPHLGR